jgi:hypothetical protein
MNKDSLSIVFVLNANEWLRRHNSLSQFVSIFDMTWVVSNSAVENVFEGILSEEEVADYSKLSWEFAFRP